MSAPSNSCPNQFCNGGHVQIACPDKQYDNERGSCLVYHTKPCPDPWHNAPRDNTEPPKLSSAEALDVQQSEVSEQCYRCGCTPCECHLEVSEPKPDELEALVKRYVPCICSFTAGFSWKDGTPCTCLQAKALDAFQAQCQEAETRGRIDGINDLSEAITSQLPPISAWDGQEARDNSLVHKLVKNAVAELGEQL